MRKYMPAMALGLLFLLCIPAEALDNPTPVGEWLVHDKTAHVRIASCNGVMWGVISWVNAPDTDKNNPDVSKRNRPVLGMPIMVAHPTELNLWKGHIYNAENGKTYVGNIRLKSIDILTVKGCVLGILCGGEDWTRLPEADEKESNDALCKRVKQAEPEEK